MEIEEILKDFKNPTVRRKDFEIIIEDNIYNISAYKVGNILRIDVKSDN